MREGQACDANTPRFPGVPRIEGSDVQVLFVKRSTGDHSVCLAPELGFRAWRRWSLQVIVRHFRLCFPEFLPQFLDTRRVVFACGEV